MAVTGITIYQDNRVGAINAMAVHSPLVFLIDLTYTGDKPDLAYATINYNNTDILTVRCIFVSDIDESTRRFKFVADEILRGLMPSYDDFIQTGQSIVQATNISKEFTLIFKDDLQGSHVVSFLIDAIHCARQIGQRAVLNDICANPNTIYIGAPNKPVYVYFYNTSGGSEPPVATSYALDYNDDFFVDYNDDNFVID